MESGISLHRPVDVFGAGYEVDGVLRGETTRSCRVAFERRPAGGEAVVGDADGARTESRRICRGEDRRSRGQVRVATGEPDVLSPSPSTVQAAFA
jgi:hypothetical protein